MRKYSYLLSVLFVGIGAVSLPTPSQAQSAKHDYLQVYNLATSAAYSCYNDKKLEECDKFNEIKGTLTSWCVESNSKESDACKTLGYVIEYEAQVQIIQSIGQ